ncbi:MAG: hypothetical protein JWM06_509, partial [Actinomycetia bacterium]|nr:hypothetical protein [Actinomycetes bacterium]
MDEDFTPAFAPEDPGPAGPEPLACTAERAECT